MAADEPKMPRTDDRPHAPIIYFEMAPVSGHYNGTGRITLSAGLQTVESDGVTITTDLVVTGYLRSDIQGFVALRDAIDRILLLAQPTESGSKN